MPRVMAEEAVDTGPGAAGWMPRPDFLFFFQEKSGRGDGADKACAPGPESRVTGLPGLCWREKFAA